MPEVATNSAGEADPPEAAATKLLQAQNKHRAATARSTHVRTGRRTAMAPMIYLRGKRERALSFGP
eukprot:2608278-Alexandrium_andersonii.AAC.1